MSESDEMPRIIQEWFFTGALIGIFLGNMLGHHDLWMAITGALIGTAACVIDSRMHRFHTKQRFGTNLDGLIHEAM